MIINATMLSIIIGGGIVLILLGLVIWLHIRLKRFTRGRDAKSLEGLITEIVERINRLEAAEQEIRDDLLFVDGRIRTALRGSSVVRFNAFKDSGGSQSFSVSLINESGDGVVLSTLYARERVGVYAKPIKEGKSEFELTEEEEQSLQESIASLKSE